MGLLSMTGFGSGDCRRGGFAITVQITSVNRKHMDIHVHLPKELTHIETLIRTTLGKKLGRGVINVKVNLSVESAAAMAPKIDLEAAREVYRELAELKNALNLPGDISLHDLIDSPQFNIVAPPALPSEQLTEMILEALNQALSALVAAKTQEGNVLAMDLDQRRQRLLDHLATITQHNQSASERIYVKLKERVQHLLREIPLDEERLLKEIALQVDRCDVTEEITRLHAHLGQMEELLTNDGSCGRKLDFLVQEMLREITTTGAKCAVLEITRTVIEFKAELERIREQIQNIE